MRRHLHNTRVWPIPFSVAALVFLVLATDPLATWGGDLHAPSFCFRLAVSEDMIGADVNEGDATLAIRAWRDAVLKNEGFLIDVHVSSMSKLVREVRGHQ